MYSWIWMIDLSSWIITVWEAAESISSPHTSLSALFFCHIWVTYCSVALCWYPVSVSSASLLFSIFYFLLSLFLSLFPLVSFFFSASLSLYLPYLSVSQSHLFLPLFCSHPAPPRTAQRGFCPGCRCSTNWRTGTFVISPLSASEQGAEFKASPIQYHRSPIEQRSRNAPPAKPPLGQSPHQLNLLFMQHQSCQSINPLRAGTGQVLRHSLAAQHTTKQDKETVL